MASKANRESKDAEAPQEKEAPIFQVNRFSSGVNDKTGGLAGKPVIVAQGEMEEALSGEPMRRAIQKAHSSKKLRLDLGNEPASDSLIAELRKKQSIAGVQPSR